MWWGRSGAAKPVSRWPTKATGAADVAFPAAEPMLAKWLATWRGEFPRPDVQPDRTGTLAGASFQLLAGAGGGIGPDECGPEVDGIWA